jgi:hypothetical protein
MSRRGTVRAAATLGLCLAWPSGAQPIAGPPAFAWPARAVARVAATSTMIETSANRADTTGTGSLSELVVTPAGEALLITRRALTDSAHLLAARYRDREMEQLSALQQAPFLISRAGDFVRLSDTTALARQRDALLARLRARDANFARFAAAARTGLYAVEHIARESADDWERIIGVVLRDSTSPNRRAFARWDSAVTCPSFSGAARCDRYRVIYREPPRVDFVEATTDPTPSREPPVKGGPTHVARYLIVDRGTLRPLLDVFDLTFAYTDTARDSVRTRWTSTMHDVIEYRWRAN